MSQEVSPEEDKMAQRLREERVRVEPHQGRFAARLGVSQKRQSFLELGERELRGDYLARVGEAGLDVSYIVTGRRSAAMLDASTSALVSAASGMDVRQREALVSFLSAVAVAPQAGPASTLMPSEAALAAAIGAFLEATPGLAGDELAQELATQLPIILQSASDEAGSPRSAPAETPPAPSAAVDADRRATGQARRT